MFAAKSFLFVAFLALFNVVLAAVPPACLLGAVGYVVVSFFCFRILCVTSLTGWKWHWTIFYFSRERTF